MSDQRPRNVPRMRLDDQIPMRDGVHLSADIYLPGDGDGPWPVLLQRTPYDNTYNTLPQDDLTRAAFFTRHGYVVVIQDVRGRGDSDGIWEPFINEGRDGHDTIVWIGEQPWCDGMVGMLGESYLGTVQWLAARERPPHLAAMVSVASAGRWMEEIPYSFGCFSAYWAIRWLNTTAGQTAQPGFASNPELRDWRYLLNYRPLRDLDIQLGRTRTLWRTWIDHPTFDDYWRQVALDGHFASIDLPILHITGWFDGDQWGEMFYWQGIEQESPGAHRHWLLVGPWDHGGTRTPARRLGRRDFGESALVDLFDLHLRFFDRWLKGIEGEPIQPSKVRMFVMGDNSWRDEDQWPPDRMVETPLFFHSGGRANSLAGDGRLSFEAPAADEDPDSFTYNPDDATPSQPDPSDAINYGGPEDNRWRLRRDDVLVYTSGPLETDIEISGHPRVVLYAASDCPDSDWHVTLSDVQPDGRSDELVGGRLRASYRMGRDMEPSPLVPGEIYEFDVELMATSNVFKKGHRIRVTVASAHYPRYARNPNTGSHYVDDEHRRIATNAIYHSPERPSHLLAPVVPRSSGD